jgi:cytochrome P450
VDVTLKPGADDPEITQFHYWNPEVQDDPNPFFDKLRGGCPVAWSERFEGFWVLSKYEDVYRAYQEPGTFSSYPNPIPAEGMGNARPVIPVEIDPPDHTGYRNILAPLFTAHRIRPLEAKITAHARELVAGIKAKGACDYATEFAKVLPTRVFLDMMGWPVSDAPMFLEWFDKLMRDIPGDPEGTQKQKLETGMALYMYFGQEVHKREGIEPKRGDDADFIDWLRGATFDNGSGQPRPLEALEILDCIFIVLLAGLDTTQGVLSLSMEFLANNPDYRRQLLDEPDLLPSAVEEFLRWYAPVLPGRRMTKDLELHGVTLKEGDRVMLGTGSACRDADEFGETAGEVDFRRKPNRHIAFGVGAHRCLGSHLARLELQTSIREWLREIPEWYIPEGAVIRKHLSAVRGVDELPFVIPDGATG